MGENELIPYKPGQASACPKDPHDKRDYSYDEVVAATAPVVIDWKKGYDIRNTLGGDIKIKNQFQSLSCVGQGWSYYIWVKQIIEMIGKYHLKLPKLEMNHRNDIDQVSSKAIYSQIFIKNKGGAYIRDGAKLLVDWGSLFERDVPSINYKTKSASEDYMRDKAWINSSMDRLAKTLQGLEYAVLNANDNMDLFAQAIMHNHGVVGGVVGQNGRGWGTENPKPPADATNLWRHCVYYGAFGTDEKGKFIATPNSWGTGFKPDNIEWKPGDPPGFGWQKLRADYFNKKWQFNPWTYIDKSNQPDMATNVKIIKDKDSPSVGIWIPALSPIAIESYCLNFGINVPKKENGDIDWDNFIDGELSLNSK